MKKLKHVQPKPRRRYIIGNQDVEELDEPTFETDLASHKGLQSTLHNPERQMVVRTRKGQHLDIQLKPLLSSMAAQVWWLIIGSVVLVALIATPLIIQAVNGPLGINLGCLTVPALLLISLCKVLYKRVAVLQHGLHTLVEVDRNPIMRGERMTVLIEQHGSTTLQEFAVMLVCSVKTYTDTDSALYEKSLLHSTNLALIKSLPWNTSIAVDIPKRAPQSGEHGNHTEVLWTINVELRMQNGKTMKQIFPFQVK